MKSPTIIVSSISPFRSVNNLLIYIIYIYIRYSGFVYIYNCYIFLLNLFFNDFVVMFFVSNDRFLLKPYFVSYKYRSPWVFWLLFPRMNFSSSFTWSLCVFFNLKWLSFRQHTIGYYLFNPFNHAIIFWLMSLVYIHVIIGRKGLTIAISLIVLSYSSFVLPFLSSCFLL